jgi:hypothetical protein
MRYRNPNGTKHNCLLKSLRAYNSMLLSVSRTLSQIIYQSIQVLDIKHFFRKIINAIQGFLLSDQEQMVRYSCLVSQKCFYRKCTRKILLYIVHHLPL